MKLPFNMRSCKLAALSFFLLSASQANSQMNMSENLYQVPLISPTFNQIDVNRRQESVIYGQYLTTFGDSKFERTDTFGVRTLDEIDQWNIYQASGFVTIVPPITVGVSYQMQKYDVKRNSLVFGTATIKEDDVQWALEGAANWNQLFYIGFRMIQNRSERDFIRDSVSKDYQSMELNALVPLNQIDIRLQWTPSIRIIESEEMAITRAGVTRLGLFFRSQSSMLGGALTYNRNKDLNRNYKNTVDLSLGYETRPGNLGLGAYVQYIPESYNDDIGINLRNTETYQILAFANYELSPNIEIGGRLDYYLSPEDKVSAENENFRVKRNLTQATVNLGYVF